MKEIPTGWKVFRVLCILQMVLVVFKAVMSINWFFYDRVNILLPTITFLALICMFLFLYMGLSLINYNLPDTPISPKQKKSFNRLFLLNCLCIVILFAQFIGNWRSILTWVFEIRLTAIGYITTGISLFSSLYLFVFHVVFLIGMYNLRLLIYKNTIEKWEDQFSDKAN